MMSLHKFRHFGSSPETILKTMSPTLRSQVISLYKQLVYLGREYPLGYTEYFRPRLKAAFAKKSDLREGEEIRRAIAHGEYVVKGEWEGLW
ncbi:complex 1 protein [Jimgerdemannia flammicorona]|uniref:Complex 1 protein n=1 Tax=Jimgerdemannia flammicorona TaxID=994334 RepID=A0A433QX68_9FUNG|nr:complex 1 protein [Jimgerdemannia flammicorona]